MISLACIYCLSIGSCSPDSVVSKETLNLMASSLSEGSDSFQAPLKSLVEAQDRRNQLGREMGASIALRSFVFGLVSKVWSWRPAL